MSLGPLKSLSGTIVARVRNRVHDRFCNRVRNRVRNQVRNQDSNWVRNRVHNRVCNRVRNCVRNWVCNRVRIRVHIWVRNWVIFVKRGVAYLKEAWPTQWGRGQLTWCVSSQKEGGWLKSGYDMYWDFWGRGWPKRGGACWDGIKMGGACWGSVPESFRVEKIHSVVFSMSLLNGLLVIGPETI
jgi:hypothetical protein